MLVPSRMFIAINILRHIAQSEGRVISSSHLADVIDVPLPYVRKVANQLNHAGFVKSLRGQEGGYLLARPATDIRLSEIFLYFDGTEFGDLGPSAASKLPVILDDAKNKFLGVLHDHSIADLCAGMLNAQGRDAATDASPDDRGSLDFPYANASA